MVSEAEKYKQQDEEEAERIQARNSVENYAYSLRNTMQDEKLKDKIVGEDKSKLESAIEEVLKWLESNQTATKDEFDSRQKELESVANPIMMKLYGGAGGMPQPDFGGAADAPPSGNDQGPTIEEVD